MGDDVVAARNAGGKRWPWRVLFALGVFWTAWASLMPATQLPQVTIWDKFAHAVNYATLTFLLLSSQARPRVLVAGGWVMFYGVVIECAQAMTTYRSGDWHDALANLVGIATTALLWLLVRGQRASSLRDKA